MSHFRRLLSERAVPLRHRHSGSGTQNAGARYGVQRTGRQQLLAACASLRRGVRGGRTLVRIRHLESWPRKRATFDLDSRAANAIIACRAEGLIVLAPDIRMSTPVDFLPDVFLAQPIGANIRILGKLYPLLRKADDPRHSSCAVHESPLTPR